jgi:RNA polymerase sigma-70 factor, ECF subfamily
LYGRLVQQFPSTGARIAQAVASAESGDLPAALAQLEALDAGQVANHQTYWVARAHVLRRAGQGPPARAALSRAIGLTEDPRVRAYLAAQA